MSYDDFDFINELETYNELESMHVGIYVLFHSFTIYKRVVYCHCTILVDVVL